MYNQNTDFFNQAPPEIRKTRFGRRRSLLIILAIVVAIIVLMLLTVPYMGLGYTAYKEAELGKQKLEEAQELAGALELEEAQEAANEAFEHFSRAKNSFIAFRAFTWVPWVGSQIKAIDSLLVTGTETARIVSELLDLAQDILDVFALSEGITNGIMPDVEGDLSYFELSREDKRIILQKIYEASPRLEEALIRIDLALESFERIPEDELAAPLREAIAPFVDQLPDFRKKIQIAIPLVKIVPQLAGYPEPKNYLLLFSNNQEMRPAGGFIGTYGILKVADGEIINFDTHDIYGIDRLAEDFLYVEPPLPLQRYMNMSRWYMRDSNWSPDFPTSAEKVLWFYAEEANGIAEMLGEPIDQAPLINYNGVISVNPNVIADLLGVVGPITVEGQEFNKENFVDKLEYQVEVGFHQEGIPVAQRKEIISVLGEELLHKIFSLPAAKWIEIIDIAEDALDQRYLVIYEKDQDIQESLAEQNWAGITLDTDGDYLMLIDANMASLKTDPFVKRHITYETNFNDEGDLIAKATINYNNTAGFSWRTTRLRNYARIYVPEGSELIEVTGHLRNDKTTNPNLEPGIVDVYDELGKTVFGAFISIEPKSEGTLEFVYKLPDHIAKDASRRGYELYVQKQAGADPHALTLDLEFGKNVKQATPPEDPAEWGDDQYFIETDLAHDREVIITF